jgi:hypothetical protein
MRLAHVRYPTSLFVVGGLHDNVQFTGFKVMFREFIPLTCSTPLTLIPMRLVGSRISSSFGCSGGITFGCCGGDAVS